VHASTVRALTELDLCVLGVIWRSGPMSAYGVRTVFRTSTTAAWSSSSGSIYPSIRRLLAAGLAKAGPPRDRRGTQELSITPQGLARLQGWMVELPPGAGTPTPDPIRTRAQFITSLEPEQRIRFVETARLLTQASLDGLQKIAEANARDPAQMLDQLGTIGSILELQARLEWLERVLDMVSTEA
jgi:DNA-binding PadR family transcriptional regulator